MSFRKYLNTVFMVHVIRCVYFGTAMQATFGRSDHGAYFNFQTLVQAQQEKQTTPGQLGMCLGYLIA